MRIKIVSFICYCFISILIGCATTTPHIQQPSTIVIRQPSESLQKLGGFYHEVEKGQTLWRISKIYDVDIETIATMNNLQDATKIEVGQKLFIPKKKNESDISNIQKAITMSKPFLLLESDFIWPVKGKVISFYNAKKDNVVNKGIDIKAPRGCDVVAARSGLVSFCDDNVEGFGRTIIIDHQDGFSSVYAHNSSNLVNVGQFVKQGALIGKVGSTGRADSDYLHFEIRKKGRAENPFYYLP